MDYFSKRLLKSWLSFAVPGSERNRSADVVWFVRDLFDFCVSGEDMLFQSSCVVVSVHYVLIWFSRQLIFFFDKLALLKSNVFSGLGLAEMGHAIRDIVKLFLVLADQHLSSIAEFRLLFPPYFAV